MAGVRGPCPDCGQEIQAPRLLVPHMPTLDSLAMDIETFREQEFSLMKRAPRGAASIGSSVHTIASRKAHEPVARVVGLRQYRHELRSEKITSEQPTHTLRRGNHPNIPLSRILVPVLGIALIGVAMLGMKMFLDRQINTEPRAAKNHIQKQQLIKAEVAPVTSTEVSGIVASSDLVPESQLKEIGIPEKKPQLSLEQAEEPKKSTTAIGLELVEKFIKAKTLSERMPMLETATSPEELAKSVLASPMPPASNISIENQETNEIEQVVDLYYSVDFNNFDGSKNPHMILVRTRGTSPPKIVADAFLDLYGGRLAAYASGPQPKPQMFRVVASPLATCLNQNVPEPDKKLTLKLLPRENTKEIAQAYFGRVSKIGRMLEDGTYSLSYGRAKACTVMLYWNVDHPKMPYLEVSEIVTMDWNP